jgi:hypothetical protein
MTEAEYQLPSAAELVSAAEEIFLALDEAEKALLSQGS